MSLYAKQEDTRTKLQEKIAADLREKAIRNSLDGGDPPKLDQADGVEDSAYIEGTQTTSNLAFVWLLVFIVVAIAIIFFMVFA